MADFINSKRKALDRYFGHLNDMQREAVFALNGPVLILAGAGSGKTTVLVNRIANMVLFGNAYADESAKGSVSEEDIAFLEGYDGDRSADAVSRLAGITAVDPVAPWNILAITFTNKAANELKSRLGQMLGEETGGRINASTFHSACVRILRREINRLGYSNRFTIYDSDDSQRLIKACMEALDISDKAINPKAAASAISSCKDKLVTAARFEEEAAGDYRKLLISKIYKEYQSRLHSADALDFDDIIMLTVKLFEEFPDVLDHYSNLYKYIMVDEYQDTNIAQYRLVAMLADKFRNLCVVGDDDQSIYRFRGATIENILNFEGQFDECKVIKLERNYRSTQTILDAANSVISHNEARKSKALWTDKGTGERITVYKAADEAAEAEYVKNVIKDGVAAGRSYKDYAVLYRMNAQSNALEKAFTGGSIPYRVIGGIRFYDRKEIRDITAYLSVINNPNDMLRFKRIVNEPKRGIGDSTLSMIEQISLDLGQSPIEIMRDSEGYAPLNKKSSTLVRTAEMFASLSEAAGELPLDELFDTVLDKTGYEAMLKGLGDEGEARLENIAEYKSNIAAYMERKAEEGEEASLSEFLEEISLFTDIDKLDPDAEAVNLMTLHSAKGLEFPIVFIIGMEDGIFPGARSLDEPGALEEERRLAYVGITRAREKLYITHTRQRMLFGSTQRNFQSKFIKEIDKECIERIDSTVRTEQNTEEDSISAPVHAYTLQSQLATKKTEQSKKPAASSYTAGDRVKHNVFGEGTVISSKPMGNDHLLEIAFDKVGTKKIMANFAKIVKL